MHPDEGVIFKPQTLISIYDFDRREPLLDPTALVLIQSYSAVENYFPCSPT